MHIFGCVVYVLFRETLAFDSDIFMKYLAVK